jgi:hypothetical protein
LRVAGFRAAHLNHYASAFETMKSLGQAIFLLIICVFSISAQDNLPRFEDYAVSLYQGNTHLPKWIRRGSNDEWRDDLGKLVDSPEVNFAGKYFIAAHSCGTGCRYYTLTDLSSGRELKALDHFTTAEPPPKTSDGYEYLTILYYRANSKLLVAQYLVDLKRGREQCRERDFLFENGKLKPITGTRRKCREF